jgi:hypothetical protein
MRFSSVAAAIRQVAAAARPAPDKSLVERKSDREQDLLAEVQGVHGGEHREDENAGRAEIVWRCLAPRDSILGTGDPFGFDLLL